MSPMNLHIAPQSSLQVTPVFLGLCHFPTENMPYALEQNFLAWGSRSFFLSPIQATHASSHYPLTSIQLCHQTPVWLGALNSPRFGFLLCRMGADLTDWPSPLACFYPPIQQIFTECSLSVRCCFRCQKTQKWMNRIKVPAFMELIF